MVINTKMLSPNYLLPLLLLICATTATWASTASMPSEEMIEGGAATATAGPQMEAPPGSELEDEEAKYREPTAAELEREKPLRDRILERWAALIDGDFEKAYQFMPPDFRARHTQKEFESAFEGRLTWKLASVKKIRYDQLDSVEVILDLTIDIPLAGTDFETTVPAYERWDYIGKEWFYSSPLQKRPSEEGMK